MAIIFLDLRLHELFGLRTEPACAIIEECQAFIRGEEIKWNG